MWTSHNMNEVEAVCDRGGEPVNWRPIAGIVLRQIYLMRGSPVRLFPNTSRGS